MHEGIPTGELIRVECDSRPLSSGAGRFLRVPSKPQAREGNVGASILVFHPPRAREGEKRESSAVAEEAGNAPSVRVQVHAGEEHVQHGVQGNPALETRSASGLSTILIFSSYDARVAGPFSPVWQGVGRPDRRSRSNRTCNPLGTVRRAPSTGPGITLVRSGSSTSHEDHRESLVLLM